jgi:hypothetical protein
LNKAAVNDVRDIQAFEREYRRLRDALANHIDDSYYPRNSRGDVLRFDLWAPVTFDGPIGDATPSVEFWNGKFAFFVSERGVELERVVGDADEILFRVFESITFSLASTFESRNRVVGQDFRQILFSKQVQLLGLLRPAWATAAYEKQKMTLRDHPMRDG